MYEVGGVSTSLSTAAAGGDGIVVRQAKPEAQGYYVFALPDSGSKSKKNGE